MSRPSADDYYSGTTVILRLAGYSFVNVVFPGMTWRHCSSCCGAWWLAVTGAGGGLGRRLPRWCAHADVCDLGGMRRVIWRCSGCSRGEGPGAKLDTA